MLKATIFVPRTRGTKIVASWPTIVRLLAPQRHEDLSSVKFLCKFVTRFLVSPPRQFATTTQIGQPGSCSIRPDGGVPFVMCRDGGLCRRGRPEKEKQMQKNLNGSFFKNMSFCMALSKTDFRFVFSVQNYVLQHRTKF